MGFDIRVVPLVYNNCGHPECWTPIKRKIVGKIANNKTDTRKELANGFHIAAKIVTIVAGVYVIQYIKNK